MNRINRGVRRGFTLLEMIMVVSIILFLLGTLVVFVSNAHLESQKQETRKIIDGIESALVTYYDEWGMYPTANQLTNGVGGNTMVGVSAALCLALTGSGTAGAVNSLDSLPAGAIATDPTAGKYFVDAWHNPISCVIFNPINQASSYEANGGMPFLYSCGPDGQCSGSYGSSLPPASSGVDSDNISNFRDLPSTTWKYTP